MAKDSGRPRSFEDLPARFPKKTTLTMKPRHYRRIVDDLRAFGVYEDALNAFEENGITIVLRSDKPDGVAKAIAAIQDKLMRSPLYEFARRFPRMAEPVPGKTMELEECPIGKFFAEK